MSTVELRKRVKRKVDQMPAKQRRYAMDYLDYLDRVGPRPSLEGSQTKCFHL
jgi:hypothetical protein